MRFPALALLGSFFWGCFFALPAGTANAGLAADCEQRQDSHLQLRSCDALIDSGKLSGKGLGAAYNNRGTAFRRLGDPRRAIEDFDRAIALIPDYANIYNNRGYAYSNLGEYRKAIGDYSQAIRLNPKHADACTNRGDAKRSLGRHSEAIEDYDRAILMDPGYARAYQSKGYTLGLLGDYRAAIENYDRALALSPDYAQAYHDRGMAHKALGEAARAVGDWEKSMALAGASEIRRWQQHLKEAGHYRGPLDGAFGPTVRDALDACARDPAC